MLHLQCKIDVFKFGKAKRVKEGATSFINSIGFDVRDSRFVAGLVIDQSPIGFYHAIKG